MSHPLDNDIQFLLLIYSNNKDNKWMMSLVTINANDQYYLEFNAFTKNYSDSLVAIDNIVLHPIEFCHILSCSFDDHNCRENLFSYQELQKDVWSVKKHGVTASSQYLNVDLEHIPNGKKSFYGLPIVNPLHSKMCVQFFFLIDDFVDLRVILVRERIDLKQLWYQTSYKSK